MMAKYKIIFSSRIDAMLLRHFEFLARVSLPAAKHFRIEFGEILKRIGNNPFQFPLEQDSNLPEGIYRSALFAKRYKALFTVENVTVYLDAVVDCREDFPKK